MWLGSVSKYRKLFAVVVTMTVATEKVSSNFCSATQTVFDCFIFDPYSSYTSKLISMSAVCVTSFINTALADAPCCYKMETGVNFQIIIFCSFGRIASMWSSINAVSNSTWKASFATTVSSAFVSKKSISVCRILLPIV